MKKSIISLFILTTTVFGYIIPPWYPEANPTTISVFSNGTTLEQTKENALEEIKIKLISQGLIDKLDKVSKEALKIEKYEVLENRHFIKASYDSLSIVQKINNVLKKQVFKTEDEINRFLINAEFMTDLYINYGYYPKITFDVNETKYLTVAGENIDLNSFDYSFFLHDYKDENLSLILKKQFYNQESYFLEISSNNPGFLNIAQFSEENDVVILLENQKIQKQNFLYPNFKVSDGLISELVGEKESREILTIIFLCKEEKNFSQFNNTFSTEMKHGKFGALISALENCNYSSVISTINNKQE